MTKVTMIGAGSTVFMKNILTDILLEEPFADCHIALQDIDGARLKTSKLVADKIASTLGVSPTIETTTDRRAALAGADFVVVMIQVGGYKPSTVIDFEIPAKYGLTQTIGDTLGIGGIMRGLRTLSRARRRRGAAGWMWRATSTITCASDTATGPSSRPALPTA